MRGTVLDGATGQPVPGVIVRWKRATDVGTLTDAAGQFTLPFSAEPADELLAEIAGYQPWRQPANRLGAGPLTVRLTVLTVQLAGAQVVGTAGGPDADRHLRGPQLGETVLSIAALRVLPVLFGETDPVKTLALLPGVQTGGEGQTGLYVRGGGQDQNLTLLDGATIYNAGHLLNFFSVFNADALRTATLLKTPEARYGGRLSSVLAVEGRDGDPDTLRVRAGLGLIASRLVVEGPLQWPRSAQKEANGPTQSISPQATDTTSAQSSTSLPQAGIRNQKPKTINQKPTTTFLLAARRTYVDVLARPFQKSADGGVPYYFYDLNARLSWRPTDADRLTLSAYNGQDDGAFNLAGGRLKASFGWGNTGGALRWAHTFSPRLRLTTTATAVDYRFRFTSRFDSYESRLLTFVRDYGATTELTFAPNPRHHLTAGLAVTDHTLRPRAGDAQGDDGRTYNTTRVQTKYAQEGAAWLTDEFALTDRVLLSAGLRWSGLRQRGPFTQYAFDAAGTRVLDSTITRRGATAATYHTPEPRVAVRWVLPGTDGQASIKAGYGRTAQYVHLVTQATSALPLDVWVPASALAPPQRAHAWSAGYFRTFGPTQAWEVSAEAYYRRLDGQLEYRDGYVAGPSNRDIEYEFVRGTGRAYGLELLARKAGGDDPWRGWASYTLARATRTFPALNDGQTFPFRFDQRHNLNLVATYEASTRWLFGGVFTYATGQALTLPARRYVLEGNVQYQYGTRNAFRMPAQHRLDLSATWRRPPHRAFGRSWRTQWQFSVYNVYGRRNPWFYYLEPAGDVSAGSGKLTAKSVALFPLPVPAVTWEVAF